MNPDAELALGLRRGDERAFERLLERRWAPLVAYVRARVGDAELARDIAQDAFVRVWDHRAELDPARSPVAYLYQVARRLTVDELRRRTVRDRWASSQPGPATAPPAAPADEGPDEEILAALEGAIAALPRRRREAFTLVHVQCLSYRQAAEAMGTAPQTVANQVAAAVSELRRALGGLLQGGRGGVGA